MKRVHYRDSQDASARFCLHRYDDLSGQPRGVRDTHHVRKEVYVDPHPVHDCGHNCGLGGLVADVRCLNFAA
jgi:hypothetical protein